MKLFDLDSDTSKNWLPKDGTVNYYGKVLTEVEADIFYTTLLNDIDWRNDEAIIFGKKIITKRKVAWYGDQPYEYTYSKTTKRALPWTHALLELKSIQNQKQVKHLILVCLTYTTAEVKVWLGIVTVKRP